MTRLPVYEIAEHCARMRIDGRSCANAARSIHKSVLQNLDGHSGAGSQPPAHESSPPSWLSAPSAIGGEKQARAWSMIFDRRAGMSEAYAASAASIWFAANMNNIMMNGISRTRGPGYADTVCDFFGL